MRFYLIQGTTPAHECVPSFGDGLSFRDPTARPQGSATSAPHRSPQGAGQVEPVTHVALHSAPRPPQPRTSFIFFILL